MKMAKIAPTSLVFGVWDSRDTQAKLPRLVSSTIRAFDVKRLRRSAQFNPATQYITDKLLEETTDVAIEKSFAERGFVHVPATGSHGGVIAMSGIRRDATLSLAALRLLAAGKDQDQTSALRRYVLGLSLVALTALASTHLPSPGRRRQTGMAALSLAALPVARRGGVRTLARQSVD